MMKNPNRKKNDQYDTNHSGDEPQFSVVGLG